MEACTKEIVIWIYTDRSMTLERETNKYGYILISPQLRVELIRHSP